VKVVRSLDDFPSRALSLVLSLSLERESITVSRAKNEARGRRREKWRRQPGFHLAEASACLEIRRALRAQQLKSVRRERQTRRSRSVRVRFAALCPHLSRFDCIRSVSHPQPRPWSSPPEGSLYGVTQTRKVDQWFGQRRENAWCPRVRVLCVWPGESGAGRGQYVPPSGFSECAG